MQIWAHEDVYTCAEVGLELQRFHFLKAAEHVVGFK